MNKDIEALFDSVTSIDNAIAGIVTNGVDPIFVVTVNVTALERGLSNPDITSQLTSGQKSDLEAGLSRGKAFIS